MKALVEIINLSLALGCQKIVDEVAKRENKVLCTQSVYGTTKYDVIYCYIIDGNGIVNELEVKGVKVTGNGELWVCCDALKISYDEQDLCDSWIVSNSKIYWHLVYNGKRIICQDNLILIPTLYNLIECIEQHY